jgi:hypothetical protein
MSYISRLREFFPSTRPSLHLPDARRLYHLVRRFDLLLSEPCLRDLGMLGLQFFLVLTARVQQDLV